VLDVLLLQKEIREGRRKWQAEEGRSTVSGANCVQQQWAAKEGL
jgi:hypothetical protein